MSFALFYYVRLFQNPNYASVGFETVFCCYFTAQALKNTCGIGMPMTRQKRRIGGKRSHAEESTLFFGEIAELLGETPCHALSSNRGIFKYISLIIGFWNKLNYYKPSKNRSFHVFPLIEKRSRRFVIASYMIFVRGAKGL
jgi:hypothetical protein